eukprot:RCo015071
MAVPPRGLEDGVLVRSDKLDASLLEIESPELRLCCALLLHQPRLALPVPEGHPLAQSPEWWAGLAPTSLHRRYSTAMGFLQPWCTKVGLQATPVELSRSLASILLHAVPCGAVPPASGVLQLTVPAAAVAVQTKPPHPELPCPALSKSG